MSGPQLTPKENAPYRWAISAPATGPLRPLPRLVLILLAWTADDDGRNADLIDAAPAYWLAVPQRAVRRAVTELQARGLITPADRPGRRYPRRFHLHR